MFTIEMLPASHGDCLWIEYGPKRTPRRILIDGGRDYAYPALKARLEQRLGHLPPEKRVFELLVITHIDSDHIGGVLKLLEDASHGVTFRDIWFNGYRHLPETPPDLLGPVQGERLTKLLADAGRPWNEGWDGEAVAIPTLATLPMKRLAGGMKLWLLSPTLVELATLRPEWEQAVVKAGLVRDEDAEEERDPDDRPADLLGPPDPNPDPERLAKTPFREDRSKPNGSSIALLAHYRGKRILLAGDAYPGIVTRSLATMMKRGDTTVPVDLLKISHHGGKKNTSPELLEAIACDRFLFSTDGSSFGHPHDESVSRVIVRDGDAKTLYFNYRSEENERWGKARFRRDFGYDAVYPEDGAEGLIVEV